MIKNKTKKKVYFKLAVSVKVQLNANKALFSFIKLLYYIKIASNMLL